MTSLPVTPRIFRHPHDITAVDTEYLHPGHAASHIIQHGGRAAFVDVGANSSVPYLLAALDQLGIPRNTVDYIFLTHVHLDHAGGAGLLMRELTQARAVVHPRGAPHMIDPEKLVAGSKVVYGEERFRRLYGDIIAMPAGRVLIAEDGAHYNLGGRDLQLLHTPGHALHHYVVLDQAHASIFTGDTFGISYRELDTSQGAFIFPTTTPTQFDPDQLIGSIDRMMTYAPESMYLMHFSRVTDVPRLAQSLKEQIRELVRIALENASATDRSGAIRARVRELWLDLLRRHGCALTTEQIDELLVGDLDLNTQGLVVWLDRQRRSA